LIAGARAKFFDQLRFDLPEDLKGQLKACR